MITVYHDAGSKKDREIADQVPDKSNMFNMRLPRGDSPNLLTVPDLAKKDRDAMVYYQQTWDIEQPQFRLAPQLRQRQLDL